jgi:hypothetical protein
VTATVVQRVKLAAHTIVTNAKIAIEGHVERYEQHEKERKETREK